MRYIAIILFLFNVASAQSLFGVVASDGNKLILDRITVSSTHAYSFRKLRTAYTGNCVRVRRSSDNTEQDIGFVANYLDTASLKSFVGSNNGFIVTWYDQSGNSRNLTQANSSNQPRIVNAGSLDAAGGKPSILLSGTTGLSIQAGTIGNSHCVSYVAGLGNSSSYRRFINIGPGLDAIGFHGSFNGNAANFVGNNSSWNDVNANSPSFSLGETNMLVASLANVSNSSTGLNAFANRTAFNAKNGSTINAIGFDFGATTAAAGGQNWIGYGSEIIFFNATLSSTERTTLMEDQIAYYNITV